MTFYTIDTYERTIILSKDNAISDLQKVKNEAGEWARINGYLLDYKLEENLRTINKDILQVKYTLKVKEGVED